MFDTLAPQCAVCGHSVRRIVRILDPVNGDAVFDVYCHGKTERTRIDKNDIEQEPLTLFGGTAFWQEACLIEEAS